MKKVIVVGLAITAILVGLYAIQAAQNPPQTNSGQTSRSSKIEVIASFYPLYEFSKNIGGDKADVSIFIPIGVEPHDWEPSTGNLLALKNSDIFVYNGGGMESFVKKFTNSEEYAHTLFVEASHGIDFGTESNMSDPHVWLDPVLAKTEVATIKDAMKKIDTANAQYYENNANNYSAKLDDLDSKIKTGLANCKKDTIVTFHSAFSYFGKRYGIKIHSLSGIVPESEVTASDLKDIVNFVKENQIKVVFAEDLVDPKLAQVLADEAGAQVLILSPLEGITQKEQANGISYMDKMEENLQNLKVAMECT